MSVLFSAYSKVKVNLRGKYCSLKLTEHVLKVVEHILKVVEQITEVIIHNLVNVDDMQFGFVPA